MDNQPKSFRLNTVRPLSYIYRSINFGFVKFISIFLIIKCGNRNIIYTNCKFNHFWNYHFPHFQFTLHLLLGIYTYYYTILNSTAYQFLTISRAFNEIQKKIKLFQQHHQSKQVWCIIFFRISRVTHKLPWLIRYTRTSIFVCNFPIFTLTVFHFDDIHRYVH